MTLLFDENLSPRLAHLLADLFPGAIHVRDAGLERASDTAIWDYARSRNFVIVSKDSDFHQRSLLLLHPPKVVGSDAATAAPRNSHLCFATRTHGFAHS